MEGIKKQPKAMFYLPGIIAICLGIAVLGVETPDRTIRFGADFYTETAEVSHVIKTVAAYFLFALGAISLGKGMTEAKRSDLMFEELGAIRKALEESKSPEVGVAPAETTSVVPEESAGVSDIATPEDPQDSVPGESAAEEEQEIAASESVE